MIKTLFRGASKPAPGAEDPAVERSVPPGPETVAAPREAVGKTAPRQKARRPRNRDLARLGWYELRRKPITTTTRQAEALNLALVETPTQVRGWVSGIDLATDQPFHNDPFELYRAKIIQSPNVLLIGDVGMGKSSAAKTDYCLRPLSMGYSVAVIDKKLQAGRGEYERVCDVMGVKPICFRRGGGGTVINPLDPRIVGRAAGDTVGQDTLLRMIAELAHGGPLDSRAGWALGAAHQRAVQQAGEQDREPVLPDVVRLLLEPDESMMPAGWLTLAEYRQWGLDVGLDLARVCQGDLAGLVDGPTSPWLDLDAPFINFDVSALDEDGPAIAIVMAVANTFLTQAWARRDGKRRLLVVEEGYHLISYASCAQIMKRNLKQGRGRGMGVVTVIHHLSDIPKSNDAIAAIKEASILHIFSQAKAEDAADCVHTFGLPEVCADLIGDLTLGHYLLKIGKEAPRVIRHLRSSVEAWVTDTDAAMLGTTEVDEEAPVVTGAMAGGAA